ncbi:hypothetical protein PoMZ_04246, partial [Pyricularia oryzae]
RQGILAPLTGSLQKQTGETDPSTIEFGNGKVSSILDDFAEPFHVPLH